MRPVRGAARGAPGAGGARYRAGAKGRRHLAGVYACYSHAWSPYFEGRIIRSTLAIKATGASSTLLASYAEMVALGRVEV